MLLCTLQTALLRKLATLLVLLFFTAASSFTSATVYSDARVTTQPMTAPEMSKVNSTLVFGVVPQQSAKKLARTWGPVIRLLGQKSGLDIKFATAPDIPTFEKRLANHEYDIAYMNPYHYVVYSQTSGYSVIAKQTDKFIRGIVVVPKNSPIQTLQDLSGETIAYPAPLAFAATLIPTATLVSQNINTERSFVKSHDSVYLSVSKGFFVAGGGVMRTLRSAPQQVQDKLRILWQSEPYTPHAIATSPKLNNSHKKLIQSHLVSIEDPSLLHGIAFKGFSVADDAQWDSIRNLDIDAVIKPTQ
ncbi:MAG: phosphate/phosphite/phosphonate ABC transporter substrate-binding protein [Glaciecola sp.]